MGEKQHFFYKCRISICRLMAVVLAVTLTMNLNVLSAFAAPSSSQDVEGFVTRLYEICLDRQPDAAGFNGWVNALKNGSNTGAQAAYGFIFSKEFQEKNLCNEDYVTSLYRCFLGREPDPAGKAAWLKNLSEGETRGSIFNGFVGSQEFSKICDGYGIIRGTGDWSDSNFVITGDCKICGSKNKTVTDFVTRLYNVCLDRQPDENGLAAWINEIKNGKSGAETAYGFIFSKEFQQKNLCDSHFVEYMYRAFFDRNSDPEGKAGWVRVLVNGGTKGNVFSGFVGSQEFKKLCAQYGIKTGARDFSALNYTANGSCRVCQNGSGNGDASGNGGETPNGGNGGGETSGQGNGSETSDGNGQSHQHTWDYFQGAYKQGYACNGCYTDVTEYEDMYSCCGGFHTHEWCFDPTYKVCKTCGEKVHEHVWVWYGPRYVDGTDVIDRPGYYMCHGCDNLSDDAEHITDHSKYDKWITPYVFNGNDYKFTSSIYDEPDDPMILQYITLNKTIACMSVGDSLNLSVEYTPLSTTSDKTISWSTSDPNVAVVDKNGVVTAVGLGEVTITVENKTVPVRTCVIRVMEPNVGTVTSAKLLIDGQDVTGKEITIHQSDLVHKVSIQTDPDPAIYEVEYQIDNGGLRLIYLTGSCMPFAPSMCVEGWTQGVTYADMSTEFSVYKANPNVGTAVLTADIEDLNGNTIQLKTFVNIVEDE